MRSVSILTACILYITLPVSSIFRSIYLPKHFFGALHKRCIRRSPQASTTVQSNKQSIDDDEQFCSNIDTENAEALDILVGLATSDKGWTYVGTKLDVAVYRRFLPAGKFVSAIDALHGGKHACVKSSTVVNASAAAVFQLFADNSRVHEYNDHIVEVKDIKTFPKSNMKDTIWTKLAWSSTPHYGPFKARDFFSVVNYRILNRQTSSSVPNNSDLESQPQTGLDTKYIIVNRPAYLSSCPSNSKYVRATVLLGGNLIEPINETQSRITMVAQINAGGSADHPAAAWIANKLCAYGPPTFLRKIEKAAQKIDQQQQQQRQQRDQSEHN